MVKKIRVIDDTPDESINGGDRDLMEMAKTMDWKLWEILQIMQRLEKALKKGMELELPELTDEEDDHTKSIAKRK
tara:strand:+ start:3551 stop:3775 length:225 start_codon:yes stop_codon:yes gene_type:complete